MEITVENKVEIFRKLAEPFNPEDVEWRAQSFSESSNKALALAYINGRAVMNRLDEIVGPENWQDSYEQIDGETRGFLCTIHIKVDGQWVSKTDGADESDIEAIKGGISDSFKRAAVKWGIGRYLYNLPAIWVKAEKNGKYIKLLDTPKLPDWAKPESYRSTPAKQKPLPEKYSDEQIAKAREFIVPENIPLAGKTLDDASKDLSVGKSVLRYLAGEVKSASLGMFEPKTDEDTKLQFAAKVVLSTLVE